MPQKNYSYFNQHVLENLNVSGDKECTPSNVIHLF